MNNFHFTEKIGKEKQHFYFKNKKDGQKILLSPKGERGDSTVYEIKVLFGELDERMSCE